MVLQPAICFDDLAWIGRCCEYLSNECVRIQRNGRDELLQCFRSQRYRLRSWNVLSILSKLSGERLSRARSEQDRCDHNGHQSWPGPDLCHCSGSTLERHKEKRCANNTEVPVQLARPVLFNKNALRDSVSDCLISA